jgi:hypothetical protein
VTRTAEDAPDYDCATELEAAGGGVVELGPAVHGEVGLLVALDVEPRHADPARHRRLEDGGPHRLPAPVHVAR